MITTKIYKKDELDFIKKYRNINHIGLPKILSFKIQETFIEVDYEYVSGIEINEYYLNEISPEEIEADFYKLCNIVRKLHTEQIIHRDIKPSNIIKDFDGEIYLIDFGISRIHDNQKLKDTQLFGTQYYAAPEQYGFGQTDERTCIYQIGVTFKELTEGKKISNELSNKITKCSQFDPLQRYQSIEEITKHRVFSNNSKFWFYFFMVTFHAMCLSIAIDCYNEKDIYDFLYFLLIMPICDLSILYFYIKQKFKPQKLSTIVWKIILMSMIICLIISTIIVEYIN